MANQRIYLVHRPSNKWISLGKRYPGAGYFRALESEKLQKFFDECEAFDLQNGIAFDNFELEYEVDPNSC